MAAVNLGDNCVSLAPHSSDIRGTSYHNSRREGSFFELLATIPNILGGIVRAMRTATENNVNIGIALIRILVAISQNK